MKSLSLLFFFGLYCFAACRQPCQPRQYNYDSVVCVCNQTYCDDLDELTQTAPGVVTVFESNKDGARLEASVHKFDQSATLATNSRLSIELTINRNETYQKIIGFGGAFTDAAGINIVNLPADLGNRIINDYFGTNGIEYSVGRIPIGGSDFSTRPYSYDDNPGDENLEKFGLAEEDEKYKIPYIKLAQHISKKGVQLFGSPWAPPAWMKTNNDFKNGGFLKEEYQQAWANYFVKFLEAYKSRDIAMWGLTVENEPMAGFDKAYRWNCLGFNITAERDFVRDYLGPTLAKSGYGTDKLNLMIIDDQRIWLPFWADGILNDTEAAKYVTGLAYHWYTNQYVGPDILKNVHEAHPDYFILMTEACIEKDVHLGEWAQGERYALDIMQNLQNWVGGWIDWNLVLDTAGGPNWANNWVNAPILVNATAEEYYKNPMFYTMGHYSKFLPTGSVHVTLQESQAVKDFDTVAFVTPNGANVVIVLNRNSDDVDVTVHDSLQGKLTITVKGRSIQTLRWFN